jgi:hypothetical protein
MAALALSSALMSKQAWLVRAFGLLFLGAIGCAQPGGVHVDLGRDQSAPAPDANVDQGALTDGEVSDGQAAVDLAGADLRGIDLAGVDLRGVDLAGVDLAGSDMSRPCTLIPQSGCNAGEKCSVAASGTQCLSNGTVATGMVCGTLNADDCLAGNLCSGDVTGSTELCRQFCKVDGDCTQAAVPAGATAEPGNVARCIVTYTGTTAMTCTVACNPVTKAGASGCPTGLACVYGGTTTIPELTDCVTPGATVEGGVCTDSSTCAAGLVCVGPTSGTAHCRQVCRHNNPADCTDPSYACAQPASPANPMFGFCCPSGGC